MSMNEKEEAKNIADKIMNALNAAASKAVLTCFTLKFLVSMSLYVIFQRLFSQVIAELWMVCIFGFTLFKYELLISAIIKTNMLSKMINGDEDDSKEKDKEPEEDVD